MVVEVKAEPLLSREHSDKTNSMDIIAYATFRYDTVEVENGLKWVQSLIELHSRLDFLTFKSSDFIKGDLMLL